MEELSFFDFIDNVDKKNDDEACNNIKIKDKENCTSKEDININDIVRVKYDGITYIGKVINVYYEGSAINVVFDNKHTTFHRSAVEKIK